MVAIRRSGGVVAFRLEGKVDPRDGAFPEALAAHRFRTIENAASEEVSVGWVTAGDPTGDSFAAEDMDAGLATWLRMRVDKKALPRKWMAIHRDVAEKSAGRKLSARERRELKDDLTQQLLPRVLPTVNFVDALLYADRKLVLLFATGKSVREAFEKLFFETFTLPLERLDPLSWGRVALPGADNELQLDRVEPVRWPKPHGGEARPRRAPAAIEARDGAATEEATA